MKNLLNYPKETIVDRTIPKTKFYKFMEINSRIKSHFVNDIVSINWLYKLSASTINVIATEKLGEIEVFVATLKHKDCPLDLFEFIDTNMPHHLVFILEYENSYRLLLNYKDWSDESHTKFKVIQPFSSLWTNENGLSLEIQGQSIDRIYENFVAQVSGIGNHKAGSITEIVELKKLIAKKEAELQALEKKIRRELQYDIQVKMNNQAKAKRRELEELNNQLEKYK